MKSIIYFLVLAGISVSCQTTPRQYYTTSPEIDLIKKANAAYVAGNWTEMRAVYVDTAKIYDNTWDLKAAVSADGFLEALQTSAEKYSEYKISEDAIYEMIITDDGQKWVHNWFLWSGTHKNGTEVKMPIHISFLMVNNKVAFQANMYNLLPAYLAEKPVPLAAAEMIK